MQPVNRMKNIVNCLKMLIKMFHIKFQLLFYVFNSVRRHAILKSGLVRQLMDEVLRLAESLRSDRNSRENP